MALLIGLVLTISVVFNHTGWRRVPQAAQARWCWLLLLSGFLLNAAYGLFLLMLNAEPVWWLLGLSLVLVGTAIITRRFVSSAWALPLDALALVEIVLTLLLGFNQRLELVLAMWLFVALLLYGVALYQRRAYVLVPVALAAWTIAQVQWSLELHLIAYSLLCILIFAAQFLRLTSGTRSIAPARLYRVVSIAGQVLVVLASIMHGALFASAGLLAHVGAVDADKSVRRMCNYSAGLLSALVFSWELSAFGLNHFDWLTLPPAVYLVVVAPFPSRDSALPQHRLWGQLCSIVGALQLLLPILWISFSEGNLAPTLMLAAEALGLLLLGIITCIRIFVLSGAALTVVAAMRALFLPSLGIPTSLALAILGVALLAIASGLSLARRRIQSAWIGWR